MGRVPAGVRDPETDQQSATAVAAAAQTPLAMLQQTTGDGAVANLVGAVRQDQEGAIREYQRIAAQLTELGPEDKLDAEQKTTRAGLLKAQGVTEKRIADADKDLRLIYEPGASNQAFNELLARRGTSSSLVDGTAVTTSNFASTAFTPTSVSWASGDSARAVDGTYATSRTTTNASQLGWGDNNLTYSRGTGTSSEQVNTDPSKPYKASSNESTTTKIGTAGATRTTQNTQQVDKTQYSTGTTTGVSRGDGKLGYTSSTTTSRGSVDDGAMTSGSALTTNKGVGAVAGADGYGAYGTLGADASLVPTKGVKLGLSGAADGKAVVNVVQTSVVPPTYAITLTIMIGGKIGTSAGGELGKGTTGSLSASGSASGSATATFTHVMVESEAKSYLAALDKPGQAISSGGFREFGILQAALAEKDDPEAVAAMARNAQAGLLADPDAAKGMAEGDSTSLKLEGKLGGSLAGGGKGSGGSVGATVGGSVSTSFTWSVTKKGGNVVLTGTPAAGSSFSAGATAGYGVGTLGLGHESTSASSRKFTFNLNPNAANYQTLYHRIVGAGSAQELERIVAEYPEAAGAQAATDTHGSTHTTTAGVAGFSLGITSGSSRTSTMETDNLGVATAITEEGSGTGGASLSVAGFQVASYTETGKISTTVGADKTAKGDVSVTTAEGDFGDTLAQFVKAPIASVVGLFTGSTKLAQHTDVAGMSLSDADYATISATAGGGLGAWQKPLESPRDIDDWNACRSRIQAAAGDRAAIGKALADFVAGDSSRRSTMVEHIVRPVGSAAGGKLYEWPGALNAQKAVFDALVVTDPTAAIAKLSQGGPQDREKALGSARDAATMLDRLAADLEQQRALFTDVAAFGEMMQRLAVRRGAIAKQEKLIGGGLPGSSEAVAALTANQSSDAQQIAAAADQEAARVRMDGLRGSLRAFLAAQTSAFGAVQAEMAKSDSWFSKPDVIVIAQRLNDLRDKVYPSWERVYAEAVESAAQAGLPAPKAPDEPKPAREWWQHLYDLTFKGH